MLSERQELVLRQVVEEYLQAGSPVGSKALADGSPWGPSTIRSELASLEEQGLLSHPHTSAGRVPTESGYRYFVDRLLEDAPREQPEFPLSLMRREVDEAMRLTSERLSALTDLLAVVTAPPVETATIRRVEVLMLQPQVVMVVVITSAGGVTKRMFTFEHNVDPGLVDWASSYLNERLVGTGLGARRLTQKLFDASFSPREREFIDTLIGAFTALSESAQDDVYVDGTSRLMSLGHDGDIGELNMVMSMLERRVDMLANLRRELGRQGVTVRIGTENEQPALRSLAIVASAYGLPQRSLGAVSVIGPLRMDYPRVIGLVRSAALQLSAYVTEVYDER